MGFGGEVGDARELVLVEQPPHQRRIADVALDELNAAVGDQRFEAPDVGRVGHRIDDGQPVVGARGAPRMHEVLADETRASGDQNALHRCPRVPKSEEVPWAGSNAAILLEIKRRRLGIRAKQRSLPVAFFGVLIRRFRIVNRAAISD